MTDDLVKRLRESRAVWNNAKATPTDLEVEAANRIEELVAKLKAKEKLVLDLAGDKIDLVSELAGVKGKLEEALELSDAGMVGEAGDHLRTTLAKLSSTTKGQDDE